MLSALWRLIADLLTGAAYAETFKRPTITGPKLFNPPRPARPLAPVPATLAPFPTAPDGRVRLDARRMVATDGRTLATVLEAAWPPGTDPAVVVAALTYLLADLVDRTAQLTDLPEAQLLAIIERQIQGHLRARRAARAESSDDPVQPRR